jgi:hypothetical protein
MPARAFSASGPGGQSQSKSRSGERDGYEKAEELREQRGNRGTDVLTDVPFARHKSVAEK